ncbi:hypothetical protein ETAA8_19280 [Anatilimnocola aggregata]|uniref:Uncharacterized protein n=1 Tax=Anatilimnocola aggregata TaxID=2528021 RepID=A0A517Y9D5_9BACT|nr:hypothetical protein [Anatilimnocola aggregata]QDU26845.1 hypothetical protein ETAA8_19280 [Anatilimnocola aggregata]
MTMKHLHAAVAFVLFVTLATDFGSVSLAQQRDQGAEVPQAIEAVKPRLSVFRLGASRDEIIDKYGQPTKTVTFASGIESLHFQHSPEIRLLVEVSPTTKRVIQIYYKKKTPFTNVQISELLNRNAEGSLWYAAESGSGTYHRLDGGHARSNKIEDEHQFAVLAGSEIRGRDAIAAEQKKAEESLKEIE